jgi:hypothetical protein
MRTGSVGNRSAQEIVSTLPEPKKNVISSIRQKLLAEGYLEEVEYDAINVEPVLIYSRDQKSSVFLRYKWSLIAQIRLDSSLISELPKFQQDLSSRVIADDDGNRFIVCNLPGEESEVLRVLKLLSEK